MYPKKKRLRIRKKRKLSLGHRQAAEVCSVSKGQTLYTDKTEKHDETFGSFITTDEQKSVIAWTKTDAFKSI